MASNQSQSLLQCNGCSEELDLESKTLPCLHSFCHSCLDKHLKGATRGKCPECQAPLILDQLSLSTFLVKSIRCRQLETTEWKCDLCAEDGDVATARHWCHACEKLYCVNCNRCHKKLLPQHNSRDLDEIEKGEVIKAVMADMCVLHQKTKGMYCKQCNTCLCVDCLKNHPTDSPRCSSSSKCVDVSVESLKQISQGPILLEQLSDLEMSLRRVIERTSKYTQELNSDYESKCEELWQNFEELMKNARQRTEELCEDLKRKTAKQVEEWHHILEENEKTLKQLETWRINLHHLLRYSHHVDVVCGVRSLAAKLSSQLNKSVPQEEKCLLEITFSNWWPQVLKDLNTRSIGSVSLTVERLRTQDLQFDKKWNLQRWNSDISSINVSNEDGHVFLCDYGNMSIIEFTEGGEFIFEYVFQNFPPKDMCWISPDRFVVCGEAKNLLFMLREKSKSCLYIQRNISTEKQYCSLCLKNDTIFACNLSFGLDSFSKEGVKIQTFGTGGSWDQFSWPLLRANPSAGNYFGGRIDSSEIFQFSLDGSKYCMADNKEVISDFCVNESGLIYFCNFQGIFSFPEKKLYTFDQKPEELTRISISRNKIFVVLKIDGQNLIKIFKIKK